MKKIVKIAAIVVAVVLVIALVAPMVLRGKIAEIVKREANAMLDAFAHPDTEEGAAQAVEKELTDE